MGRSEGGWDGALRSRYECKYLVSPRVASEIRQFIRPFMKPDRFAHQDEGNTYSICSLYLDTFDLHLYRQTVAGELNRFKLRVRSYSDDPSTPVYLEVKRRMNDVILKRRAKLARNDAIELLTEGGGAWSRGDTRELMSDLAFFSGHVDVAAARPFLRVKYQREAYESVGGDPLRLTIDSDIAWHPTLDVDLRMGGDGWIPTPLTGMVLEIKFTETYPGWVAEMIRIFDLHRQSVAKYVLSVDSFFTFDSGGGPRVRRAPGPPPGWDGRPAWARGA